MAVSKVILNGETLMDVTVDTVTSEKLLSGYQATGRDGQKVQGSYVPASISLIAGSTNPNEETQHIMPPSGYDGFSYFDVGAIDSDYVGSAITQRSSTDLSFNNGTFTAPSGYYGIQATKIIASASAPEPSITLTSSTGKITSTVAVSSAWYPANSSSSSYQLSTVAASTITPTESVQTAVESGRYTLGNITVAAIPSDYIGSAISSVEIVEGTTTVSGSTATRGVATWSAGVIQSGQINAATFANSSSAQTQYVDISNTTDAPVLVSGGYLYINKGYTDDLKISLAKLVPDGASADLASDKILSGYAAYNNDGTLIAGNIPSKNSADVTILGSTVSVPSGYYSSVVSKTVASGSAKVNNADLVRIPSIVLDNTTGIVTTTIPYQQTGVDAALTSGYITSIANGNIGVTGSSSLQLAIAYGSTITPTESSQIAVASGSYTLGNIIVAAISSNYIGSAIAQRSIDDLTATGSVVNVPSGYYSTAVSTAIKGGSISAVAVPSFIPSFSVDSNGIVTITQNTTTSVLPTLTSGYIDTVSPFTVIVAGTSTYQLPVMTTADIDYIVNS